ncbi:peptidoglycan D,D-transpeptidase FtsI family protein [Microbacterium xanthum]|uniref:peptidoglycan D,D-transpeptidase FtsI family protein n=1 Tax=Microbacterium xanthum TaxID=3079794 RepID=UPI002AD3B867|nr:MULTISPECIES: penicillin-binding protein 2 [unclassified Microbacterium]MDZ8172515.1 penicillin-binding protein 2 [Microbacterium sp. KSW-48]MDZ8202648.1 penicillin-binding protein 2 [Microbacterium sp. SSW1-59]
MTTRATRSPRRRTVVALAVVLSVLAAFIVRLVDIQVVNADDHIEDSLSWAFGGSQELYGTRGSIVDADGEQLAGSILTYDAQLDPSNAGDIRRADASGDSEVVPWPTVAAEIASITGQSGEEVMRVVDDALAADPNSQYAQLAQGLTTQQYRDLVSLGVPFLYFEARPDRTYVDGAVAGALVGYVGSDGVPLAGLELSQNACLEASDGTLSYQKGKDGVIIPGTSVEEPAVDGGTLMLTIDRDLQWYMQQLIAEQAQDMGAQYGSILVVEAETGKIRAAAEYPTVDPNDVESADVDARYSQLFTARREPGSTFKALTAATLLDTGAQTPYSTVDAASFETFPNGARVRDAFVHPSYTYTLTGALIDSSNVAVSKFSERVSAQTRYDYLADFGIGAGVDVGYSASQSGYVRPVDEWDNQTFYNLSFGQGLETTMPELAQAFTAITNDGVRVPLSLIESCTLSDGTVVEPEQADPVRVISESTADQVGAMLENVFLQSTYADDIAIAGYRMAGKTGTAEKTDGKGGYKVGAYFTSLIGYAPAEDPQYIVLVNLDEPTKVASSSANVPAFQKAMTQVLKNYRVMPSTTSPEELPKFG